MTTQIAAKLFFGTVVQPILSTGGSGATVYQTSGSAYNLATIEQQGTTDVWLISQSEQSKNNRAAITQGVAGNNNASAITQTYAYDGGGNTTTTGSGKGVTINQNLTTTSSLGNQAEVTQGFAGGISTVSGNTVISDDNTVLIN